MINPSEVSVPDIINIDDTDLVAGENTLEKADRFGANYFLGTRAIISSSLRRVLYVSTFFFMTAPKSSSIYLKRILPRKR